MLRRCQFSNVTSVRLRKHIPRQAPFFFLFRTEPASNQTTTTPTTTATTAATINCGQRQTEATNETRGGQVTGHTHTRTHSHTHSHTHTHENEYVDGDEVGFWMVFWIDTYRFLLGPFLVDAFGYGTFGQGLQRFAQVVTGIVQL